MIARRRLPDGTVVCQHEECADPTCNNTHVGGVSVHAFAGCGHPECRTVGCRSAHMIPMWLLYAAVSVDYGYAN